MANSYIILNSLWYRILKTRHENAEDDYQIVEVTVTGKTVSQRLGFTDETWGYDLLAPYTADGNYGSVDNLKAAASLAAGYCTFMDEFGTNQGNVFVTSKPLVPRPVTQNLEGWYIVPVALRKRQI